MTALFTSKKKTPVAKKETKKKVVAVKKVAQGNSSTVLLRPRITEKATLMSGAGVYAFEVSLDANKQSIQKAVEEYYKVTPEKIRIVRVPAKVRFVRGRWGKTASGKKAYVYLPKGKTIEIV